MMNEVVDSSKRIAFVMNALTGKELRAGNRDVSRVYALLTDPNLGECIPESPMPLHQCKNRHQFWDCFSSILRDWQIQNQLIFYFSGHGELLNDIYCIWLGESDFLPFSHLLDELKIKNVHRAIIVLDTCYSGAAIGVKSSNEICDVLQQKEIPKGIAILASSLASQTSHELSDGSSSVYTDLFCRGIETGLDGRSTDDGMITIGDIVSYISDKFKSDQRYSSFNQRPVFAINYADRDIWISKNKSGKNTKTNNVSISKFITTREELEILYRTTIRNLHPCAQAGFDDLDWKLVEDYAKKTKLGFNKNKSQEALLSELGFLSQIPVGGKYYLHKSAALCFCKRPDRFYSQARSIFLVGNPDESKYVREDIYGPLSRQIEELVSNVIDHLPKISYMRKQATRHDSTEIDIEVLRELISNAIAHRDYENNGVVTVQISQNALEIKSPGLFPPLTSWKELIESELTLSVPVNAAISHYLTNLLTFEGIGRGFGMIRGYIKQSGNDSIICKKLAGEITYIRVLRKISSSVNLYRYRSALKNELGSIQLLGAPGIENIPVNLLDTFVHLDVSPNLLTERKAFLSELRNDTQRDLSPELLLKLTFNKNRLLLILGDPGSGKTTLLRYYAISCLEGIGPDRFGLPDGITPIYFPVRELNVEKSVGENLSEWALKRAIDLSADEFREILHNTETLIMLDGLDEVNNINDRKRACVWIDNACVGFSKARFIVTSRWTGYRKSDSIELSVPHLRADIRDFTPLQQEEFLQKWFRAALLSELHSDDEPLGEWRQRQTSIAAKQAQSIIESLHQPSNRSLRELAGIPVILQIIAIMWLVRRSLPASRANLFDVAIDYLLEYRDSQRQLSPIMSADMARLVLSSIALWLQEERLTEDVPKEIMHQQMQPILDMMENRFQASTFCENLRDRAGIIADYGVDAYIFRHKSFREFLAAERLIRDAQNPGRIEKLVKHFGEDSWGETIRFFINLSDDKIFDSFIEAFFISEISKKLTVFQEQFLYTLINEAPQRRLNAIAEGLMSGKFNELQIRYALNCLKIIKTPDALKFLKDFGKSPYLKTDSAKELYNEIVEGVLSESA